MNPNNMKPEIKYSLSLSYEDWKNINQFKEECLNFLNNRLVIKPYAEKENRDRIIEWLKKNCTDFYFIEEDRYKYDPISINSIYFRNQDDMYKFKLSMDFGNQ